MTRDYVKNVTSAISFKCGGEQCVTVEDACALIDKIYDECEAREMILSTKDVYCNDCKHYLSDNGNFPIEPCGECTRFYADKFERKDDEN